MPVMTKRQLGNENLLSQSETHVSESIQLLEKLVSSGRYLEARQLTTKLKGSQDVNQVRVDQLLALSLSKSGSPESALEHLEPVYRQHADDPETAGIMGGIYKDLFKKHQDSKYAILSRDTYLKNFQATKNFYPGINAATMSAIAGRAAQGREIASQVIALLNPQSTDFWELATLGEAHLLTKNRTQSVEFFIKARQLAGTDWGKVTSVYNQLWLLNHYAPVPKEIQKVFSPPAVVAFVGHMIDHPERTVPRFPASIESNVKEAIKGAIKTLNASIGYCSLACGGDILFAEAMEEAGVTGLLANEPIGAFTYDKRLSGKARRLTAVDVYAIQVTHLFDRWPEAHERERRWFGRMEAVAAVDEPELKRLIAGFAP